MVLDCLKKEFQATKFSLNLLFVQISIVFYWIKKEYSIIYMVSWNTNFTQYLEQIRRHVSHKITHTLAD